MKPEETVVYNFLVKRYGDNVIFEPDGNVPPDFLIDGVYAAEVRRLNHQFVNGGKTEGLEQVTYPLFNALAEVLESFNSSYSGISYWVGINFHRPLPQSIRKLKTDIKNSLITFLSSDIKPPHRITVNEHIELTIYKSSNPIHGMLFGLHGGMDHDSNGWVLPIYVENTRLCITEKSSKIQRYLPKYIEWWLILVDYIGWGLDKYTTSNLAKQITDLGNFTNIKIISNDGNLLLSTTAK